LKLKKKKEEFTEKIHENKSHIERKTKTQLNKEKRKKEFGQQLRAERRKKNMKKDLERLEEIVQTLDNREDVLQERRDLKEIVKKDKENIPKKLGKYRFEDPPTAVLLSEELPKNLRSIPVVIDPFKERFQSFQKRNIIEVHHKLKRRQVAKFGRKLIDRHNMEL